MSKIKTLIDCEDALYEIEQAQVILELVDDLISKHYSELEASAYDALVEIGYVLGLYRDQEIKARLEAIRGVMREKLRG